MINFMYPLLFSIGNSHIIVTPMEILIRDGNSPLSVTLCYSVSTHELSAP